MLNNCLLYVYDMFLDLQLNLMRHLSTHAEKNNKTVAIFMRNIGEVIDSSVTY